MRRVVRVVWSNAWWSRHLTSTASFRVPAEIAALHGWPARYTADVRLWAGAAGSGEDIGSGLVPLGGRRVTVTDGAFGLRIPARLPGQLPGEADVARPDRFEVLFVIDAVDGQAPGQPEPVGDVINTQFVSQFQSVACQLRFWRWPRAVSPSRRAPPAWFARWTYVMDRVGADEPYIGLGAVTESQGVAGLRWAESYALGDAIHGWLDQNGGNLATALARVGEAPTGLVEVRRTGPRFRGGPWGSSENLLWLCTPNKADPPLTPQHSVSVLVSALDAVLADLDPEARQAALDGVDAVLTLHQRR
jgi:hypothetical protein